MAPTSGVWLSELRQSVESDGRDLDRLPKKIAETQRFKERRNPSADVDGMTMESASHVASNKHPHGRSCIAPPRRKRPCIPNTGNDFWQLV
jgi:hypothetical protein